MTRTMNHEAFPYNPILFNLNMEKQIHCIHPKQNQNLC